MSCRWITAACCLALVALSTGCATHSDRLQEVRECFYSGNLALATQRLEEYEKRYGREADVFKLDRAMLELAAGRPRDAERLLREVRDSFDYLTQPAVAEKAAVMLSDDTQRSYPGEDYERVLIRAMLAISNLLGDAGDAQAYALQTSDLQEQIIHSGRDAAGENPKLAYQRVALGAYLHGMLSEATHRDYDDAERYFIQVCSWEPAYALGPWDLERARRGRHSQPGHGVLYVFALVGRGPYKEETAEVPSTVSLLIADRILSATSNHTLPPTIAPVKVPRVVAAGGTTRSVAVSVDRQAAGETVTVTDIGRLAVQQYDAIYPQVLARAVVRRVVKKGIIYGAKEVTGVENGNLANLALDVGGVVWEAAESADTRCWGLLPDRVQVLRLELPVGEHSIGVRCDGGFGAGACGETKVRVDDGRNSYVLGYFADGRLVGQVLANCP